MAVNFYTPRPRKRRWLLLLLRTSSSNHCDDYAALYSTSLHHDGVIGSFIVRSKLTLTEQTRKKKLKNSLVFSFTLKVIEKYKFYTITTAWHVTAQHCTELHSARITALHSTAQHYTPLYCMTLYTRKSTAQHNTVQNNTELHTPHWSAQYYTDLQGDWKVTPYFKKNYSLFLKYIFYN